MILNLPAELVHIRAQTICAKGMSQFKFGVTLSTAPHISIGGISGSYFSGRTRPVLTHKRCKNDPQTERSNSNLQGL